MTDPTTPTLPEESRGTNALEDARALLKYALEIVESDGGYCEATRLEERVARAYIKSCEALEAIRDDAAVPPFVQLIARSALTTPAAVDTAKDGEPKEERLTNERIGKLLALLDAEDARGTSLVGHLMKPREATLYGAAAMAIRNLQSHRAAAGREGVIEECARVADEWAVKSAALKRQNRQAENDFGEARYDGFERSALAVGRGIRALKKGQS